MATDTGQVMAGSRMAVRSIPSAGAGDRDALGSADRTEQSAHGGTPVITAMPRIAIVMHDFDLAIATFRDGFGMPVSDFSGHTVPHLGAHVAMCTPEGGSNVELMAPADPAKPLSQSLQRCLDRRGEGPYALMLEAPDPDVEAEALSARGLDVLA